MDAFIKFLVLGNESIDKLLEFVVLLLFAFL